MDARLMSGCSLDNKLLIAACLLLLQQTSCIISVEADESRVEDQWQPLWLGGSLGRETSKPNERLEQLLNRVGPSMRASSDYHDFTDIHLNDSIEAWQRTHRVAKSFAQNQVHLYGPKLVSLFQEARVGKTCQFMLEHVLQSMAKLDSWAVKMWSSTGSFPPVGLLDGQFTDLGSYRGCVDTLIPKVVIGADWNRSSESSGYTNYCMLPWRPVVPRRPDFHMIFQEHQDLVKQFNASDVFSDLSHRAQYYHYVYLRTGVCVPHECSPHDMERVVRLVGHRLSLMSGPVRCFTRASSKGLAWPIHFDRIEDEPVLMEVEASMNFTQRMASIVLTAIVGLISVATLWHGIENIVKSSREASKHRQSQIEQELELGEQMSDPSKILSQQQHLVLEPEMATKDNLMQYKAFIFKYFSILTNGKEYLDTSLRANEIKCLHGLRVLTMTWIIVVHTLQYNEWSGFFRAFENVVTLQNIILQPIYNANYCVDHFFFISGLLASYTSWFAHHGIGAHKFSAVNNLIARYLRLTPQVFVVSLLFIILPLIGDSPFWYDISARSSWQCQQHWWINLLHLQAFYKYDQMCNLVSWWISIDMSYYVISVFIIYMILNKQQTRALYTTGLLVIFSWLIQAKHHYNNRLTPNNLGVVPQVNEVWTEYVIKFFMSPFTHAYPFFLGLWFGIVLANNKWRDIVRQWSQTGWLLSAVSLIIASLSSHIWMSGRVELGSQLVSTAYNLICAIVWTSAFAWIVIACHYGTAKWFDDLLSIKPFILLSKASFIIYLSHMLIVRSYFGLQNGLLEVSIFNMTYAILGNILLSIFLGVLLCIVVEVPALKFQKYVLQVLKTRKTLQESSTVGSGYLRNTNNKKNGFDSGLKVNIKDGPVENVLLN